MTDMTENITFLILRKWSVIMGVKICIEEQGSLVIKCTNVFWISWYVNANTAFAANSIGVRDH